MKTITPESLADVEFQLNWNSKDARHEERLFTTINLWRDIFPPGFYAALLGKIPGDKIGPFTYDREKALLPTAAADRITLNRRQFRSDKFTPQYGRFYPLGLLDGLANVFPGNAKPFRVTGLDNGHLQADLNHPLAGYDLTVSGVVHNAMTKPYDRGGECAMLIECLADGPGMQVRANGRPTDFLAAGAFARDDTADDALFYQNPRFVNHIDDKAIDTITGLYGSFARPGMDVLDLMSAWRSHVPENAGLKSLVGLGMNAAEMADNPQLTDYRVHDLNADPKLPFADNAFDLVLCTVSVEYLVRPEDVFCDVARVLRPGGRFVVTFSNRWFPPKAIKLWQELHEFERMGLVLEYFRRSETFTDLQTLSSRGWPRPESDKYYPEFLKSDPVYAVWGSKDPA